MSVRLIHLSDIHFGCENAAAVAAARDYVLAGPADLVVVTGDVTQSGARRQFRAAEAWLSTLPGPQLRAPGNHDTPYWNLVSRLAWPWRRYSRFLGPEAFASFFAPDLAVISLNTARAAQPRLNWSKGQLRLKDAERAAARLCAAEGLRVAICHHPLMEVTGGPMTGRVWGGVAGAKVLAEAEVDLVLSGHVHMPFAHALPFGDERTYTVGASTLSLRERGCPAGFTVIEADEEHILITALGWERSRFEPQRSWGFDRRQRRSGADSDQGSRGWTSLAMASR
jgi:3',5'-cyclic AMP phosphodiesterase CpdA